MMEEKFIFTSRAKRNIFITMGIGFILMVLGIFAIQAGNGHGHGHDAGHGEEIKAESKEVGDPHHTDAHGETVKADAHADAHGEHGGGHAIHWSIRIWKNIWHNSVFFTGIAVIGVFFIAFNYIAQAGWGTVLKRVPESFGYFIPVAAVLIIIPFFLLKSELFHWWDPSLYNEFLEDGKTPNPNYDHIIASKTWYLGKGFYIVRMFLYFAIWFGIWSMLRKYSVLEDEKADLVYHNKSIFWSAIFLLAWGVTSSSSAWDWVMSIDPHFFSTMFGWYVFASWFVSGLAAITLITIFLKDAGYLPQVNENHLHDMGKFCFAFSIFWTYIWFAQFLLIYYANIPEESVYFIERLQRDNYTPIFFINIIVNFCFPFLVLMTREAKRQNIILKIVCIAILCGHWLDFYLMLTPATMKETGGLDAKFLLLEAGMVMIYLGLFIYAIMFGLTRANLVPKNHPFLEESIHHHVY